MWVMRCLGTISTDVELAKIATRSTRPLDICPQRETIQPPLITKSSSIIVFCLISST